LFCLSRLFPDVSLDYLRKRVESTTEQLQHNAVDFQRLYETLVEDFLKNNYDKEPASASSSSKDKNRTFQPSFPSSWGAHAAL
jgi:hypothetical protein